MRVNAIAVVPAAHSGPEDWLGLALYPRAAMLNHACEPNVAASFGSLQLRIHALTALEPSAVLRLSYGPQVWFLIAFAVRLLHLRLHRSEEAYLYSSWAPDMQDALHAMAHSCCTRDVCNCIGSKCED